MITGGFFQLIACGPQDSYKSYNGPSYGKKKPSLSERRKAKSAYSTKKVKNHYWIFQGKLYKTREKLMIAIIEKLEHHNPIKTDIQSLNIVMPNMSNEQQMVMQLIKTNILLSNVSTINTYEFNFDIEYMRFKKTQQHVCNGELLSTLMKRVGKNNLIISTSNIKEIIETEHRIENINVLSDHLN